MLNNCHNQHETAMSTNQGVLLKPIKKKYVKKTKAVRKKFYIKYMSKKPPHQAQIKETKCIRLIDFAFPLDYTCLEMSIQQLDKPKYNHPIIISLFPYKRITSIVYLTTEREYMYEFEERWPSPCIWKGFNHLDLFLNFLNSYQNATTQELT